MKIAAVMADAVEETAEAAAVTEKRQAVMRVIQAAPDTDGLT